MSYVLFSQTSIANGTRDTWNAGAQVGATGATTGAVVNGALVMGVANSSFNEMAIAGVGGWNAGDLYSDGALVRTGDRALYNLGDNDAGTAGFQFNTALNAAFAASGNVLGVADNGISATNRTLDDLSGFTNKVLNFGLADINWNDIKNVEVRIDSADTGANYEGLTLRSFVDARVKIGDTAGCRDASDFLSGRREVFTVEILDGKRGQIEGAQSDMALDATIDVWTNNSGWQNSFSNTGSVYADTFDVNFGVLAVARGLSEFGIGAGRLVDATDLTFDGVGELGNQQSAYNGQLTTLLTNMGAGDDTYDATTGVSVVASGSGTAMVAGELQTIDYVWGGSADDVIKTGGNNDVLFGDFGSYGSIGQAADPAAIKLEFGGSDVLADWVNDTGVMLYAYFGPTGADGTPDAKVSQSISINPGVFDFEGGDGPLNATAAAAAAGLGVGAIDNASSNQGNNTNGEINTFGNDNQGSDVLGVNLGRDATGASFDLSLFYAGDGGSAKGSRIEQALVTIGSDTNSNGVLDAGEVTGSFILRADGTTHTLTGAVTSASGNPAESGGSIYSAGNPGLVEGSFTATSSFNVIEFASAGLVAKSGSTYTDINTGDVSDFYLRELCFTLAVSEGNDTLEAGSGIDFLNGGGDTGSYEVCSQGPGNLLANGGFETIAADAAQQENATWYLTDGATAGAGAAFGWAVAPTVLTFEDFALAPGAEQRIPNGYGGFDWVQTGVFNASAGLGGYTASSSPNIGFIAEAANNQVSGYEDAAPGTPVTFTRAEAFDLVSAQFSAAFRDLQVTATAFDGNGAVIGTKVFAVNTLGGPDLVDFTTDVTGSFAGARKVTFDSNDGNNGTNDYFGFDDLTVVTQNIEIQKDGTGGLSPFAGTYKLELDSHPTAQANPLVSQAVETCAGGLYVLDFALAERQGAGNASSDFQLFWDGAVIATFTNQAGSDSWSVSGVASGITVSLTDAGDPGAWFTAKVTGLVGDGADSVGFQSLNGQTNTFGTFIDAVALTEVAPVATLTNRGDTLSGGAHADTFAYALGDGVDLILDYNKAEGDKIDLDNLANYSVSNVVYDGVLSTLIESNLDDGAIIVRGVAMANVDII